MKYGLVACLAAGLYFLVGTILFQRLRQGGVLSGAARNLAFGSGAVAVVLHAVTLYAGLRVDEGLNLALINALSLVAWAVALLFLAAALYRPVNNLGIVIMPIAGLAVLAAWLWPGRAVILPTGTGVQSAHIIISILAYGLLTLAMIQSLLLLAQERQLRHRRVPGPVPRPC